MKKIVNNEKDICDTNDNLESLMIDSTVNGIVYNQNEVKTEAVASDVAALILASHLKPSTIKLNILGKEIEFNVKVIIEHPTYGIEDLKRLTKDSFKTLVPDVSNYFKGATNKAFGKGIEIKIGDKGSFNVYPSTGSKKNTYFLNFSCAPHTILMGNNSFPAIKLRNEDDVVDLTALPVKIVIAIIEQLIYSRFDKKLKSALRKDLNKDTLSLKVNRLQIAMMTAPFESVEDRNLALMILYTKYSAVDFKRINNQTTGYSVPLTLGAKIDTSETTYETDSDGAIVNMSGFLVKQYQGKNHLISVGFYCKDLKDAAVFREKHKDDSLVYTMPKKDIDGRIDQRIRLDITFQSRGLQQFSHQIIKSGSSNTVTLMTIRNVFKELLREQVPSKKIINYVFKDRLQMRQLLLVTKQDWLDAFDIMKTAKSGNYVDLVDAYKKWNGDSEKYTTFVMKTCGVSEFTASKLREHILEKTGVDISFPYKVWQTSNAHVRRMFLDNEIEDDVWEGKKSNSIDYQKQTINAIKTAYKNTKDIHRQLFKNGAAYFTVSE